MTIDATEIYTLLNESKLRISFLNSEIATAIGRSEGAPSARELDALESLFLSRAAARLAQSAAEEQLKELKIPELEFGYSHAQRYSKVTGGYIPITEDGYERYPWYSTAEEAEAARANDQRWSPQTFLISRPKPEAAQRFEGGSQPL